MQNNAGPTTPPCCTPLEQSILRSRVYLEEHGCRSLAVTFGDEQCECRHASGRLHEHHHSLDRLEKAMEQSMRISQFFASW